METCALVPDINLHETVPCSDAGIATPTCFRFHVRMQYPFHVMKAGGMPHTLESVPHHLVQSAPASP